MIKAKIYVILKEQVNDPQGIAVQHALESLRFKGVQDARVGKIITLTLNTKNKKQARMDIEKMCEKILANPVTEDYWFELENPRGCGMGGKK